MSEFKQQFLAAVKRVADAAEAYDCAEVEQMAAEVELDRLAGKKVAQLVTASFSLERKPCGTCSVLTPEEALYEDDNCSVCHHDSVREGMHVGRSEKQ